MHIIHDELFPFLISVGSLFLFLLSSLPTAVWLSLNKRQRTLQKVSFQEMNTKTVQSYRTPARAGQEKRGWQRLWGRRDAASHRCQWGTPPPHLFFGCLSVALFGMLSLPFLWQLRSGGIASRLWSWATVQQQICLLSISRSCSVRVTQPQSPTCHSGLPAQSRPVV